MDVRGGSMLRCPRCSMSYEPRGGASLVASDADLLPARCEACGVELISDGLPPVARTTYTDLVTVYEGRSSYEVLVVRALLGAEDVPTAAPTPTLEHLTSPGPIEVGVPRELADRALRVLRERGVLPPEEARDREDLGRIWARHVAPMLEGGGEPLARELALRDEAFRRTLYEALARLGARGLDVVARLVFAFAARGPLGAAREAAAFLASREGQNETRLDLVRRLGALAETARAPEVALRVAAAVERFRALGLGLEAERALVPLLEHEDAGVRDEALEALYSLSGGQTLGYDPEAREGARREAVERWWTRVGGRRRSAGEAGG